MALWQLSATTMAVLAVTACSTREPAQRIYGAKELVVDQPGRSDFADMNGLEHQPPGRATLLCEVGHLGLLERCKVETFEGPQDSAVRRALIRGFVEVAQSTRVKTRASDGTDARGQRYRLAVRLAAKD